MSEGQHTEKTDPYTIEPTASFIDAIKQIMQQVIARRGGIGRRRARIQDRHHRSQAQDGEAMSKYIEKAALVAALEELYKKQSNVLTRYNTQLGERRLLENLEVSEILTRARYDAVASTTYCLLMAVEKL